MTRVMDFGAFVAIAPGKEGLVHISQLAYERVNKVEDIVNVGDKLEVKLIKIDDLGRLDFSRKALLPKPEGYVEPPPRSRSTGGNRLRRTSSNGKHGNRPGRQ